MWSWSVRKAGENQRVTLAFMQSDGLCCVYSHFISQTLTFAVDTVSLDSSCSCWTAESKLQWNSNARARPGPARASVERAAPRARADPRRVRWYGNFPPQMIICSLQTLEIGWTSWRTRVSALGFDGLRTVDAVSPLYLSFYEFFVAVWCACEAPTDKQLVFCSPACTLFLGENNFEWN